MGMVSYFGHSDADTAVGGYVRRYPRQMHTPPMRMWHPPYRGGARDVDFGNELNNPQPHVHHDVAVRSTGRVRRYPAPDYFTRGWMDNMISDGQVMSIRPDPTLVGVAGAPVFSSAVWLSYNSHDQLGWRV